MVAALVRTLAFRLGFAMTLLVIGASRPLTAQVSVSPASGVTSAAENSGGHTVQFTVTNTKGSQQFVEFWCNAFEGGSNQGCFVSPMSATLAVSGNTTVTVTYSTPEWSLDAQSGDVSLGVGDWIPMIGEGIMIAGGQGHYTVNLTTANSASVISTAPHNGFLRSVGRCVAACFDVTASYTSVPYISEDQPRSVTLMYNSASAAPHGLVEVDAIRNSSTAPDKLSIEIWKGLINVAPAVYFVGGADTTRLVAQFSTAQDSTGAEKFTVIVKSYWTGTVLPSSDTVRVLNVNERYSRYGAGWAVSGLQRIIAQSDGSIVLTDGTGSIIAFTSVSCSGTICTYQPPAGEFSRIRRNTAAPDSSHWTQDFPDSTNAYFHADGRLHSVVDHFGRRTRFQYDSLKRLTHVIDPLGYATQLGYRAGPADAWKGGTLHSIAHSINGNHRGMYFGVDTLNNLLHVGYMNPTTNMDQTIAMVAEYDSQHRLKTWYDRRWSLWDVRYDHAGKLDTLIMPMILADGQWQRPRSKHTSRESQLVVNTSAGLGSSTNPASAPSRIDSVRISDPGGHSTTYKLDRLGQVLQEIAPLGLTTTITRSTAFQPVVVEYPTGVRDSIEWNAAQMVSKRAGSQPRVYYRYGAKNQVDSIWTPSGPAQRLFLHPGTGRTDSIRYSGADSTKSRYYYNVTKPWQLDSISDSKGHRSGYRYESTFRNIDSSWTDQGRYTRFQFDAYGRTWRASHNGLPWKTTVYDELNRIRKTFAGTVHTDTVRFEYDGLLVSRIRDPQGNVYRFEFNGLGWKTREYDPADTLTRFMAFGYDVDGLLSSKTNREQDTVNLTYDARLRLLTRSGTGVETANFEYNALGTVTVGWNSVSVDSIVSRADGTLESVVTWIGGKRFQRSYTVNAKRQVDSAIFSSTVTGLTFPLRKYNWDSQRGHLASIQVGSQVTAFVYDADGFQTGTIRPKGIAHSRTGNANHDVASVQYSSGNATFDQLLSRGYSYTASGQIRSESKTVSGTTSAREYDYDDLARLAGSRESSASCEQYEGETICNVGDDPFARAYSYDSVSNRRDRSDQYASGSRLTHSNGFNYTSNDDGHRLRQYWAADSTQFARRYKWSADGMLQQVWMRNLGAAPDSIQFSYNAFAKLVRRSRGHRVEKYYLWNGNNVWLEVDSSFARVAEYEYVGVDKPFALITSSTSPGGFFIRQIEQDVMGRVVAVTDSTTIAQRVEYDDWGAPTTITALSDTAKLFWKALLWQSDAGLYYMRSRWYDPASGRFLSEDPIRLAGGLNLYAFAGADPINGWDPTGLSEEECWGYWYSGGCHPVPPPSFSSWEEVKWLWESSAPLTCTGSGAEDCMKAFGGGGWMGTSPAIGPWGHVVIALVTGDMVRYSELLGWGKGENHRWLSEIRVNQLSPTYTVLGFVRVAGAKQVGALLEAIHNVSPMFDGLPYFPGDSNHWAGLVFRWAGVSISRETADLFMPLPFFCVSAGC